MFFESVVIKVLKSQKLDVAFAAERSFWQFVPNETTKTKQSEFVISLNPATKITSTKKSFHSFALLGYEIRQT